MTLKSAAIWGGRGRRRGLMSYLDIERLKVQVKRRHWNLQVKRRLLKVQVKRYTADCRPGHNSVTGWTDNGILCYLRVGAVKIGAGCVVDHSGIGT